MSTRVLVGSLATAVVSLVTLIGPVAAPVASAEPGSIVVRAVGDRDAGTGLPVPLSGARVGAYANGTLTISAGECATDAAGECSITGLAAGTYWVAGVEGAAGGAFTRVSAVTTTNGDVAYADVVAVGEASPIARPLAFRRTNPPYPPRCGVRVSLVFDVSGSIDPDEMTTMKAASLHFVDALAGSPSSIAIDSFATTAPAAGNTNHPPVSVETMTGVDTVKAAIVALAATSGDDQYTNWDAALRAAAHDHSDVVLLFTDGNPTVHGVPAVFPPVVTDFDQIEAGVLSANALKAAGVRVVAVGIGDAADISAPNLRAVSGPIESEDYAITTFAGLEQTFADLADALCPKPALPPIEVEPEIVVAPVPIAPKFTG